MKIDSLFSTANANTPDKGPWHIETLVQLPPQKFFRQTLYLRIAVSDAAEQIVVDDRSLSFKASFNQLSYNVLDKGSPFQAKQSEKSGGMLMIELDTPKQIQRVALKDKQDATLEFYRLDGDTPADKPTITTTVHNGGVDLQTDGTKGFADARFGLLVKNTPKPVQLKSDNLTELKVLSFPTGPRIGLCAATDPLSPIFFYQKAGEFRAEVALKEADSVAARAGSATAPTIAENLTKQIQLLLNDAMEERQEGKGQTHIDLALVVESDAPCSFNLKSLVINYTLVSKSFATGEDKKTLKFSGKGTTSETVKLTIPAGATFQTAMINVVESFKDDRPVSAETESALPSIDGRKTGVYVNSSRWVAQITSPSECRLFSGIAIGLMALSADTELLIEIQDDLRGQPSGHKLISGALSPGAIGIPDWLTFIFPEPLVIPAEPHWILIRATKGNAVWLSKDGKNAVRILADSDEIKTDQPMQLLEGQEALQCLVSPIVSQQSKSPASALFIEGQPVKGKPGNKDGSLEFDLRSALQSHTTKQKSGDALEVPLTFSSGFAGFVTIYPPHLEFNI